MLSTPNEEDDLTEGSNVLLILFDWVCQEMSFPANIGNIFRLLSKTMHNVLFVQYDGPVSKSWNKKTFSVEKFICEIIFAMFFWDENFKT